jgi:hypothetical protein
MARARPEDGSSAVQCRQDFPNRHDFYDAEIPRKMYFSSF